MSALKNRTATAIPNARAIAIAALLGATMLAAPLVSASAQTTSAQSTTQPATNQPATSQMAPAQGAPMKAKQASTARATPRTATSSQPETVEQRIAALHTELKITPAEENDWKAVAQAMRDNAAAMQKLVDERNADAGKPMTAVDDLSTYQKFAQTHADGVKNLISSFDALYQTMPDPQKKIADQVFSNTRKPS